MGGDFYRHKGTDSLPSRRAAPLDAARLECRNRGGFMRRTGTNPPQCALHPAKPDGQQRFFRSAENVDAARDAPPDSRKRSAAVRPSTGGGGGRVRYAVVCVDDEVRLRAAAGAREGVCAADRAGNRVGERYARRIAAGMSGGGDDGGRGEDGFPRLGRRDWRIVALGRDLCAGAGEEGVPPVRAVCADGRGGGRTDAGAALLHALRSGVAAGCGVLFPRAADEGESVAEAARRAGNQRGWADVLRHR